MIKKIKMQTENKIENNIQEALHGSVPLPQSFPGKISAKQIAEQVTERNELVLQLQQQQQKKSTAPLDFVLEQSNDPNIDLRSKAAGSAPVSVSKPSADSRYKFGPFQDETQTTLVVNIAHRGHRPQKDRPAIRFLGIFEEQKEARSFAMDAGPKLKCTTWMSAMQKWILITKTTERQKNSVYTDKKINVLKKLHQAEKQRRNEEFQKNKDTHATGETDTSVYKQKKKLEQQQHKARRTKSSRLQALKNLAKQKKQIEEEEKVNSQYALLNNNSEQMLNKSLKETPLAEESEVAEPHHLLNPTKTAKEVPNDLMQRKQDFLVVSWMPDISKPTMKGADDPEPAVIVWRAFPSYDMAHAWVEDIASKHVFDFDLEIVDNYEWLFPEDVDREKIQESFRNPQQNRIMLQYKAEADRVSDFTTWCKQTGQEVPTIDVLPISSSSSAVENKMMPVDDVDKDAHLMNQTNAPISLPLKSFDVQTEIRETKDSAPRALKPSEIVSEDFSFLRRPTVYPETKK